MQIERTDGNKLVITLPEGVDNAAIQRIIDYFRYFELTSKSKATQQDADLLAEEANTAWLKKHRATKG
jgi:hypothetical protein